MSTTSLGEVVSLLSFTIPIPIGDTHETNKVILSEFSSIMVSISATQKTSLVIAFSNDAINFDYTITNQIDANVPKTITSVIVGKWCKISVLNNSAILSAVRVSSYCSTQPSTVQSSINSVDDNFQNVNIDNWSATLDNQITSTGLTIISSHDFPYSRVNVANGELLGPDRGFRSYFRGGVVYPDTFPEISSDKSLYLYDIFKSPLGGIMYTIGDRANFGSGNNIGCKFNIKMNIAGYDAPVTSYDNMMIGMGSTNEASGDIIDGIFMGYGSTGTTDFSIIYYENGAEFVVPQKEWAFDLLDGNGSSRVLLDPFKFNTWRIRSPSTGTGSLFIEYHNPFDNEYIAVHRIQNDNIRTTKTFNNPSFSFMMYSKRTTAQPGTGNKIVSVASSGGYLYRESGPPSLTRLQSFACEGGGTVTIPGNTETVVLACRSGELLNNVINHTRMDFIFLSVTTDGNRPVEFRIYSAKDSDYTGALWNFTNSTYTPGQELANKSSFNVGNGFLLFAGYLQKSDSTIFDIDNLEMWLYNTESIVVTAQSVQSSDINSSFTYTLIQ
jgi:hypothetical protein